MLGTARNLELDVMLSQDTTQISKLSSQLTEDMHAMMPTPSQIKLEI